MPILRILSMCPSCSFVAVPPSTSVLPLHFLLKAKSSTRSGRELRPPTWSRSLSSLILNQTPLQFMTPSLSSPSVGSLSLNFRRGYLLLQFRECLSATAVFLFSSGLVRLFAFLGEAVLFLNFFPHFLRNICKRPACAYFSSPSAQTPADGFDSLRARFARVFDRPLSPADSSSFFFRQSKMH